VSSIPVNLSHLSRLPRIHPHLMPCVSLLLRIQSARSHLAHLPMLLTIHPLPLIACVLTPHPPICPKLHAIQELSHCLKHIVQSTASRYNPRTSSETSPTCSALQMQQPSFQSPLGSLDINQSSGSLSANFRPWPHHP